MSGAAREAAAAPAPPGTAQRESVVVYTFHRCASSLFAGFVLPQARGRRHVDHQHLIYSGASTGRPRFEPAGFVYGPIRLTTWPGHTDWDLLVRPASDPRFVRDRIALFVIRDPRDVLVSAYYAFGWSHGYSPVPETRAVQERWRRRIQRQTVDEYALETAPAFRDAYLVAARLIEACRRPTVLRYEEMIDDWHRFAAGLSGCLDLDPAQLDELRARTRPRSVEEPGAHRRSGRVGDHRRRLAPATVGALDRTLGDVLTRFGYAG